MNALSSVLAIMIIYQSLNGSCGLEPFESFTWSSIKGPNSIDCCIHFCVNNCGSNNMDLVKWLYTLDRERLLEQAKWINTAIPDIEDVTYNRAFDATTRHYNRVDAA
jgi:hypothetical protein